MLKLDQLVAAKARLKRQGLLRQTMVQTEPTNVFADSTTRCSPAFLLVRIDLISSRRHASMSRELGMKVCPTNSA